MDKAAIILFVSNVSESNFSEEIFSNLKEKEIAFGASPASFNKTLQLNVSVGLIS